MITENIHRIFSRSNHTRFGFWSFDFNGGKKSRNQLQNRDVVANAPANFKTVT